MNYKIIIETQRYHQIGMVQDNKRVVINLQIYLMLLANDISDIKFGCLLSDAVTIQE